MLDRLKALAYTLLANPLIRKVYEGSTKTLLRVGGSSRVASHTYHTVAPLSFSREQHAVLSGRRTYYENLATPRRSVVELRRNTHRLEKGLLMQPPRPVFALDYIGETIDFFEQAVATSVPGQEGHDIDELRWAEDVLATYFERVGKISEVRDFSVRYEAARNSLNTKVDANERRVPYKRDLGPSPVAYDDLAALAMRRRSVRWFKQQPVPRELIDKALLVGRQSPTACNRMPYEFRIFDEPELVRTVAGIPFGAAGYAENVPVIAVLVGKLDSFFSPRDRHGIYIDTSLAAMGFMYALESLGLSSCVINWPDFEPLERKMQRTLGLELHERPIMLIALGYADPDGLVAYSQKKELATFRSYNLMPGSVKQPTPRKDQEDDQ